MPDDLSLITCSYNTPEVLELCLKSFVFYHGRGPHNIYIIENSTDSATQKLLDSYNIEYIKNPGGTHSLSIDLGFQLIKTQYALLVDTDILFKKNIDFIFHLFKRYDLTLLGEIQGNRGEFLLYPRVAPYFSLINMKNIRTANIKFHDEDKIRSTHSEGFFKNMPINYEHRDQTFYDVGATFYETVKHNKFKIANLEEIESIVFHAESLSWTVGCGIEAYEQMGKCRQAEFHKLANQYKDVDIRNCFRGANLEK